MVTQSVNDKNWQLKTTNEYYVQQLSRKFYISDVLAKILSHRLDNLDVAEHFLSPKIKYLLPDPFHLLDMQVAVNRTIEAIAQHQQICIFADYDVDGATSAALLKNVFRDINCRLLVEIYVPDRIAEGYGPTLAAMQKIRCSGASLVITVDCGATAHEALEHAKNVGLEVIVIDHHLSLEVLPAAIAVVNPNRLDETSPYKNLAAVGVTFLFACALIKQLEQQDYFAGRGRPDLIKYLDLVALGTVCDVMPITELNRAFVQQGLKVMSQRRNIGVRTLCDLAGLDQKPSCYHLGFIIGPRINAGGRVGRSSLGANLLSTLLQSEASLIAEELEVHNNQRKVIELIILQEALEIAETQNSLPYLFVVGQNWHPGIIGIIAGRLKEKFNKPVAVIAVNGHLAKASCRSVKGVDFGSKIIAAKNQQLILAGGGHQMAAGFTAESRKLPELQKFLEVLFVDELAQLVVDKVAEYDLELTTTSVNPALMAELEKLEPYGHGNLPPLFKFANLFVLKANIIKGQHIKCLFAPCRGSYGSKAIDAIAFNAVTGPFESVLLSQKPLTLTVIGSLKLNNWQNIQKIQLQINDLIVDAPGS